MRRVIVLILLLCLLLGGCANYEVKHIGGKSIDQVRREIYTPEAYEAIKDVRVYQTRLITRPGDSVTGASCGTNFWSTALGLFVLRKTDRATIIEGPPDLAILVHEDIHQLDDLTRDGEANFISLPEFESAYLGYGKIDWVEARSDYWITDTFGNGRYSEQIAYVGSTYERLTPRLRPVYRHIFKAGK